MPVYITNAVPQPPLYITSPKEIITETDTFKFTEVSSHENIKLKLTQLTSIVSFGCLSTQIIEQFPTTWQASILDICGSTITDIIEIENTPQIKYSGAEFAFENCGYIPITELLSTLSSQPSTSEKVLRVIQIQHENVPVLKIYECQSLVEVLQPLSKVLQALYKQTHTHGKSKGKEEDVYIPFRDCELTHLLSIDLQTEPDQIAFIFNVSEIPQSQLFKSLQTAEIIQSLKASTSNVLNFGTSAVSLEEYSDSLNALKKELLQLYKHEFSNQQQQRIQLKLKIDAQLQTEIRKLHSNFQKLESDLQLCLLEHNQLTREFNSLKTCETDFSSESQEIELNKLKREYMSLCAVNEKCKEYLSKQQKSFGPKRRRHNE